MLFLAALTLVSNLQWHTDLEEAKRAAQREGKPILSLRLLGNLDEELSCANSRLYRTVVYTDPVVASYLREHFILHWQSVRPAPKITIDFGDGRKITTTVTGNSIHYILAPDGHVIDAIPGLYTPRAFLDALQTPLTPSSPLPANAGRGDRFATAIAAMSRTVSKAAAERPVLNAITMYKDASLDGYVRADDVVLSDESLTAIRAHTRARSDEEFAEIISLLKATLDADTKYNETLLRPRIRAWIASGITNVDQLNEKIYAEIFLTPFDDPWLGLLTKEYTGLENDGVTTSSTALSDRTAHRLSRVPAESSRSRR